MADTTDDGYLISSKGDSQLANNTYFDTVEYL